MRLWSIGSSVAALLALSGVAYQQTRIGDLQEQLDGRSGEASDDVAAPLDDGDMDTEMEMRARIAALERIVSSLSRLAMRERAGGASEGPEDTGAAEVVDAELELLRDNVDALLVGEGLASEHGQKRLREAVREVQHEAFEERRREWRARRDRERDERVKRFAEENRLSAAQLEALLALLADARTERREVFEGVREGEKSHDEAREQVRAVREETDRQVQELLDEQQFEAFEEMRGEERRSWSRGPHGMWEASRGSEPRAGPGPGRVEDPSASRPTGAPRTSTLRLGGPTRATSSGGRLGDESRRATQASEALQAPVGKVLAHLATHPGAVRRLRALVGAKGRSAPEAPASDGWFQASLTRMPRPR